jgi:hypothetical protein
MFTGHTKWSSVINSNYSGQLLFSYNIIKSKVHSQYLKWLLKVLWILFQRILPRQRVYDCEDRVPSEV